MTGLYILTLFLSALLLFSVQPMMGKMLLPVFGGAPAVWQTTLLFFQATLLAGYGYAHWSSKLLRPRFQLILHAALLMAAALFLPLGLGRVDIHAGLTSSHQSWHLMTLLFQVVGLPFFILSSTSPLLQRWFSTTQHVSARDPYYLSVASNAGSLVALFSFPVLIEPSIALGEASRGWAVGYALLLPLIIACAINSQGAVAPRRPGVASDPAPKRGASLPWKRKLLWIAMAAIPSSLMLGLTSFVTTEVASIPLLGILPLGLYLATFILAFAQRRWLPLRWLSRLLPFAALALAFQIFTESTHPILLIVLLHLVFFFVAALLCHTRLAEDRPSPEFLTEFYLWMSVGGVVGGLFNTLAAPALFVGVAEYPIAIVLACALRTTSASTSAAPASWNRWDAIMPAIVCGVVIVGFVVLGSASGLQPYPRRIIVFALGAVLSFVSLHRALRFALSLGALFLSILSMDSLHGRVLDAERNFFGVSRVTLDPDGRSHRMVHGNTIHGRQRVLPSPSCEPLTYFHRSGPLGRIFKAFETSPASRRIGVTGLGCGAIAGYARPGQEWDYYEIDPAVIRIASDARLFTFLHGCAPAPIRLIEGDARLRLQEAADGGYDLLIMDAFSSDSIPLHLLTREALALYIRKLAPPGLLAINISNRYLDLGPVVAALASDAGLPGYHWEDPFEERDVGKEPSHWAVMSRQRDALEKFRKDERWRPLEEMPGQRPWTDDFSNVLGAIKWRPGPEPGAPEPAPR
ncbi:MAG: fused MFS/spermidine synthase [Verrucomicrobia bacterium]|nr:fused MFS/spermidine synthase [Verrucomicrobiota bacterium]MBI3867323.1 fused MFS/spermidine synthase [Verrucomicrobiota bacterium]